MDEKKLCRGKLIGKGGNRGILRSNANSINDAWAKLEKGWKDKGCGEGQLAAIWCKLGASKELRNVLTHRFRLPWNENSITREFGYPGCLKEVFAGGSTNAAKKRIDDEIWGFIVDEEGWNEKVRGASAEEFVSGREMVRGLHDSHARFCEKLFAVLLRDID